MAIDLHTMKPITADRTVSITVRNNEARLKRPKIRSFGVLSFPLVEPTSMVKWVAAQLNGVTDASTDGIRVRLCNGVKHFYLDDGDDLKIKEVTDVDKWNSEYFSPYLLGNLDLWTHSKLQIVVCLFSTERDPDPRCSSMTVVMDLPAWEGAVSQALTKIVEALRDAHPILTHKEVTSEDKSEWRLGNDYTERGYVLTELVQVMVDGAHKSAVLNNGIVTVSGPPVKAGSSVVIAVKYQPDILVRRTNEAKQIERLPVWVVTNLVQNGTRELTGRLSPVEINGVRVQRRMLDLQISFRGVGHRQVDVLAMREAALNRFSSAVTVTLDSRRDLLASIRDTIEVVPRSGESFPEAVGELRCIMYEYPKYDRVVMPRRLDGDRIVPQTTVIDMAVGDDNLGYEVNSQTIDSGRVTTNC